MSAADNIRFGMPEATDQQVVEAAKLALADEFITQMKDGYETVRANDLNILKVEASERIYKVEIVGNNKPLKNLARYQFRARVIASFVLANSTIG